MIDEQILKITHFKVFGHTITVAKDPELSTTCNELSETGCFGISDQDQNLIIIQNPGECSKSCDGLLAEAVIHEMTHIILDNIGYSKLSANERFVRLFAKAAHQVIKTVKFENEEI